VHPKPPDSKLIIVSCILRADSLRFPFVLLSFFSLSNFFIPHYPDALSAGLGPVSPTDPRLSMRSSFGLSITTDFSVSMLFETASFLPLKYPRCCFRLAQLPASLCFPVELLHIPTHPSQILKPLPPALFFFDMLTGFGLLPLIFSPLFFFPTPFAIFMPLHWGAAKGDMFSSFFLLFF